MRLMRRIRSLYFYSISWPPRFCGPQGGHDAERTCTLQFLHVSRLPTEAAAAHHSFVTPETLDDFVPRKAPPLKGQGKDPHSGV